MCDYVRNLNPRKAATTVAAAVVTMKLISFIRSTLWKNKLAAIRDAKRKVVVAEIVQVRAWVESDKDAKKVVASCEDKTVVKTSSIRELQQLLASGAWTVPYLLKVFYANLLDAHAKTNCVVAVTLDDAIAGAIAAQKKIDEADSSSIEQLFAQFPLLGMPFSIKDNINVKGTDSTLGVVTNAFHPKDHDGHVVRQIRRAGGIILAKTNIPQTLLSYECFNDLFGSCGNPVKPEYTCGGSSGGEGSLVALGGSCAGIGSDIGGSVRIPAHFCGIYGLKPSQFRIPNYGQVTPVTQEAISSVLGPMSRNIDDLTTLFKATIADASQMDGLVMNVPFRQEVFESYGKKTKLRFAYYTDDGFVQSSPACKRAVEESVAALRAQGHECVEIAVPNSTESMEIFYWFLAADGGKSVDAALKGDTPSPAVKTVLNVARAPSFVKKILGFLVSFKSETLGVITSGLSERSVKEYYDLLYRRNELRHAYAAAVSGFDAVIAPGLVFPAPKIGATAMLSYGAAITGFHNILDNSVVTVPVTTVDKEKDQWAPVPSSTKNNFMVNQIRSAYNATEQHGLPVGVQVVCTRFSEEQVLAIAGRLDAALKGK